MKFKHRKLVSVVLTLCLAFSLFTFPAFASDINGHWAQDTLVAWSQKGLLSGYGNGDYRPDNSITRAEFVALVNRIQGYTSDSGNVSAYKDVSNGDWYYNEFAKALAAGYLMGSDGMLYPNNAITRNEAVAIIARIAGLDTSNDYSAVLSNVSDSGSIPSWAEASVGAAVDAGYIAGFNGKFEGSRNITRAEAVVLLDRLDSGTRTYAFAGTYGGKNGNVLNAKNVIIMASGVTLANLNVSNNLTITEAVGNGEVYLDSVTVAGKLDIQGGGANSVYLKNSKISEVVVTKDAVHVVMQDGTTVTYVTVAGENPSIEIGNGVKIDKITISDDAVDTTITVNSGATIQAMDVKAEGVDVNLGNGATVVNMTISSDNSNVTLQSGAKITTLNVTAASSNAVIKTNNGSSIGTITLDAPTVVSGAGKITTAVVNVNDVVIETKPDTTKVADNVTVSVGNTEVAGVVSATPTPAATATANATATPTPTVDGSSGGSTSTPTPVVPTPTPTPTPNYKGEFEKQMTNTANGLDVNGASFTYENGTLTVNLQSGKGLGSLDVKTTVLNELLKYSTDSTSDNYKITNVSTPNMSGTWSTDTILAIVGGAVDNAQSNNGTGSSTVNMNVDPGTGSSINMDFTVQVNIE